MSRLLPFCTFLLYFFSDLPPTFQQWFSACALLASVGVALMSLNDRARPGGVAMVVFSTLLVLYCLYVYQKRHRALTLRLPIAYADLVAPLSVSLVFSALVTYSVVVALQSPHLPAGRVGGGPAAGGPK